MTFTNGFGKRRASFQNGGFNKRRVVFKTFNGGNNGNGLTGGQDTLVTHRVKSRVNPRSFRQLVLKNEPTKHFNATVTQATFTNNTIYNVNITAGVTVGNTDVTRIGDTIDIMALKVKGHFTRSLSTPAGGVACRILVGWSGEEVGSSTFATTLAAGDLYLSSTGTGWVTDGIINPKAFTVLHDQTMDMAVGGAEGEVNSFAFTVPINQKFVYQSLGSTFGKTKNLFLVVMGNVEGGAAEDLGIAFVSYDLIYK